MTYAEKELEAILEDSLKLQKKITNAMKTNLTNAEIRETIINLLDDEDGICDPGFCGLYELACVTGNEDVVKRAEQQNSKWFLGETDADELRLIAPQTDIVVEA